jgi:hypothetical protein
MIEIERNRDASQILAGFSELVTIATQKDRVVSFAVYAVHVHFKFELNENPKQNPILSQTH